MDKDLDSTYCISVSWTPALGAMRFGSGLWCGYVANKTRARTRPNVFYSALCLADFECGAFLEASMGMPRDSYFWNVPLSTFVLRAPTPTPYVHPQPHYCRCPTYSARTGNMLYITSSVIPPVQLLGIVLFYMLVLVLWLVARFLDCTQYSQPNVAGIHIQY